MESFQENSLLYNITAGIVVLVLFLLVLKFIESLSKTLLIFIGIVIVGYGLIKFFPEVTEPVAKFLGVSWTKDEKSYDGKSDTYPERDTYNYRGNYNGGSTYDDGASDSSGTYDENDIYDDVDTYQ